MTEPARLMKDQPRSQVARKTLPQAGSVVCGQLHHEGSGITCEELGLLQDDTRADDGSHANEVSRDSHQRRTAEQRTCDEADDGHLSAAGDEAGGHDGHTAVALVLDGTRSHDARDAAARADQHGNEALTGQAELPEIRSMMKATRDI